MLPDIVPPQRVADGAGQCAPYAPASRKPQREVQIADVISHLRAAVLRTDDQRERGHVVYFDAARRFLGEAGLGAGSVAGLVLRPREILAAGFQLGASGMILAHNHPSGACQPSQADRVATQRLAWLGQMVDLALIDHLIITTKGVYSMRAGGPV